MAALNRDSLPIEQSRVSPISLGRLICRIDDQSISGTIAKDIFSDLWDNGGDVDQIIEARGLKQISDSAELEQVVEHRIRLYHWVLLTSISWLISGTYVTVRSSKSPKKRSCQPK